ncbi:hemolysin, partial [Klebsiella oxytoca]
DNKKNNVTEDEIKSLIQYGTDAGELRKIEQDIMERALVLGDLRISSIMTPKVHVLALRLDMNADDVRKRLSEELHSYYPVFCDKSQ